MAGARCRNLILILGDQLDARMASLRGADPARDVVLMAEVMEEARYVRHHVKKIAFLFSAMRHFAADLETRGWRVEYRKLDDPSNAGSLCGEVGASVARLRPQRVIVAHPGEWRVLDALRTLGEDLPVPLDIVADDRFIASIGEFASWAQGRKQLRMEYFYRDMRRKTGLLMERRRPGRRRVELRQGEPQARKAGSACAAAACALRPTRSRARCSISLARASPIISAIWSRSGSR